MRCAASFASSPAFWGHRPPRIYPLRRHFTRAPSGRWSDPSLIAVAAPVAASSLLGVPGVIGLLVGGLCTGFVMAVFLFNTGGAWDNAKKYIEEGQRRQGLRGPIGGDRGHRGRPFKDTSGPSLNILVKLMSIIAIAHGRCGGVLQHGSGRAGPWKKGVGEADADTGLQLVLSL